MSRLAVTFILPTLIAGGVLLGSGPSRADDDQSGDVSVHIHDGQVDIDGVRGMVDAKIDEAIRALRDAKDVPPEVRERVRARLERLRGRLDRRLAHIDVRDLDKLGEELGKMGEDIGKEMEGLGGDVDQWSKGFAKLGSSWPGWGGRGHDGDDNDRDDDGEAPTATVTSGTTESSDSDSDDGDDEDIARGIGDLGLQPPQREAIQRLRADTDRQIAAAKAALKASSHALRDLLAHPGASDADIARAIDTVSQQEATIRKARILAWVNARRLLDDAQRARVEAATHRSH